MASREMWFLQPLFGGFSHGDVLRRWRKSMMRAGFEDGGRWADGVFGDGGRWRRATAEGRLYNCSPRLACLLGVGCRMRDLPPKSGCINYLQAGDVVSTTALRR